MNKDSMSMGFSLVICTYNRASSLIQTLESIYKCKTDLIGTVDVLVIVNNCTDDTLQRLENFHSSNPHNALQLRWIEEPAAGKSHALNRAIEETQSELLIFVDDDQLVDDDFLSVVSKTVRRYPEFGIFCGWMMPAWDGSEPSWVHESGEFFIRIRPFPEYDLGKEITEVIRGQMKLPSGGNIVVRRSVFDRIGYFSTELGPTGHNLMGGEDVNFVNRAIDSGIRILYIPGMRQLHTLDRQRMAFGYMLKKSYSRSFSSISISSSHTPVNELSLLRKMLTYIIRGTFCLNSNQRFYWLIRLAAAYGEFRGQRNYFSS